MRAVSIAGTAALSAFGRGTRGLAAALAGGAVLPGMPADVPLANPRARKLMSRAAYLAARCMADLLAAWPDGRDEIGCFLGVGASGGEMGDMIDLIDASIVDGELSMARFGDRGLAACNPLLAFQLMNNFTMCHGAILEGLGGPNGAIFSRGAGTVAAIAEAVHAVASGDCDRAVCGGADSPTHPVTMAELAREGFAARGMRPADGAGMIAIRAGAGDVVVEHCGHASGRDRSVGDAIAEALGPFAAGSRRSASRTNPAVDAPFDALVIAPWGPPADDALRSWAASARIERIVSLGALGDTVAAAGALAMIAAHDLVADGAARVLALVAGIDGDIGAIVVARGAA